VDSRPQFFRVTGLYERRLLDLKGGGHLAGDIGLTYAYLNFKLNGTVSPQSPGGGETTEDFYAQALPVPMLGISLEQPISERTSFAGSLLAATCRWSTACATKAAPWTSPRATSTCCWAFAMR
jgi:hypothetical protein